MLLATLGYRYGVTSKAWTATASVTVQDPQSEALGTTSTYDPKRYVADQAHILESYQVAAGAADALAAHDPPYEIAADSLYEGLETASSGSTDVIRISFTHPDPDLAIAAVNETIAVYATVQRDAAQGTYASALEELDNVIAELESELSDVSATLATQSIASAEITSVETSLDAAISNLLALDAPRLSATQADLSQFRSQYEDLEQQIATLRDALASQQDSTVDDVLVQQKADLNTRLAALQAQRDEITANTQIAGNGVAFIAEAISASPSSVMMPAAAGGVAGALMGVALAFYLAARRRHFSKRGEPELVLGTALTADVPDFSHERLSTTLPVRDAPHSAAAEAFRFVAGTLTGHLGEADAGGHHRATVVAVVAPSHTEGTTTVAANTALAAAGAGWRVALVDTDFAAHTLTNRFEETGAARYGLTDLAAGDPPFRSIGHQIGIGGDGQLVVYGRGRANPNRTDFFASANAADAFERLRAEFDLVIVDTPPLLRVAASSSVVRLSDLTLVVIRHGGNPVVAAELRDRMATLAMPMVGYVYNRGPLRREMAAASSRQHDLPPAMSSPNQTE